MPAAAECVLVIDIGSSSTRCVAFGLDCEMLHDSLRQDKSLGLSADATFDADEVIAKTELARHAAPAPA